MEKNVDQSSAPVEKQEEISEKQTGIDWATKRKITVLSMIAGVLFVVTALAMFFLFYEESAPVSEDLPSGTVSDPIVLWERAFPAREGSYSLVAYIENPNTATRVSSAPYEFSVYDRDNVLLETIQGTTVVPPDQFFAVFEGPVSFDREPARVTFRFADELPWRSVQDHEKNLISVSNRVFSSLETRPRVQADFTNTSILPIKNIEAVTIVYDSNNVAIGASRTVISELKKGETTNKTFTWPRPFDAGTRICQQPADTMLVIDRSGSMQFDSEDPPQPLTDVKEAAKSFLDMLSDTDKAGMVSFATEASDPIDQQLTSSLDTVKQAIDSISIGTPHLDEHTNIADGIRRSLDEMRSSRRSPETSGVIVLLSDGVATRPLPPEDSDLSRQEYPKQQALDAAEVAAEENIELYVIGLGEGASGDFLRELAPSSDNHFFAPTTDDLDGIYQEVATSVCEQDRAVVRILTKILE
ncbi:MAG: vWA domain-containing protein [Candidatus Paceibacterota bacterium]